MMSHTQIFKSGFAVSRASLWIVAPLLLALLHPAGLFGQQADSTSLIQVQEKPNWKNSWGKNALPKSSVKAVEMAEHGRKTQHLTSAARLPARPHSPQENGPLAPPASQLSDEPLPDGAEIIVQRYPDGKPQIERSVIQDENGNFLNHGPWTLRNRSNQIMAQGKFHNGLMHGTWQRWHPLNSQGIFAESPFTEFRGPFLSVASFNQGKLDGTWTIFDQFRRKILEIPFANGQRHGLETWYWANSTKMRQVEYERGQLHGMMVEWDQRNNVRRRTEFKQGRELITRTQYYYKEQRRTENSFLGPQTELPEDDDWWNARPARVEAVGQEIQHGPSLAWYSNGQQKMRGQYENGFQVGIFSWWHENGQKQISGEYRNGSKSGSWTWWHNNGMKAIQGNYTDDAAEGLWTWWEPSGQIDRQENLSAERTLESIDAIEGNSSDDPLSIAPEEIKPILTDGRSN